MSNATDSGHGTASSDNAAGTPSALLSPGAHALPRASDDDLANKLAAIAKAGGRCAVAANAYTVRLFERDEAGTWVAVCSGDFAERCVDAVKPLLRKKLLSWVRVAELPASLSDADLTLAPLTLATISAWRAHAEKVTVGRGKPISEATRREVIEAAAWRCQFDGCGRDLRKHLATGLRGQFSYLAHIVASSADGPRGDAKRSPALADDPTNILLLCDECHRLIDRVAPDQYDESRLQAMRTSSIEEVARLLNYLKNDAVDVLRIVGNITGQRPHFYERDADEALWKRRLRSATGRSQHYFDLGGSLHEPHSTEYWYATFRHFKEDIVRLRSVLYGTDVGGAPRGRLAIFPLHGTSILVLERISQMATL